MTSYLQRMTKHLLKHKDMKTTIKTLFATALTAIVLTSSAFSGFANAGTVKESVPSKASGYDMIQIKGNVRVYLKQSVKENIEVSVERSADQVSVQQIGNKLLINSTASTPAVVYISLKDLRRIEASDDSYVKTDGNFNLGALQVFLKGNAEADINTKTGSLYTVIKDQSHLKLAGETKDYTSVKEEGSKLNVAKFAALRTSERHPVLAAIDFDEQFLESLKVTSIALRSVK